MAAMTELLGFKVASWSETVLKFLSVTAIFCGSPVVAGSVEVGRGSQTEPVLLVTSCFSLAELLF